MSLQEFYDALRRHDWTYEYSDDNRVWRRGSDEHKRLQEIAKQSPEHQALFDAMKAFGWGKGELPERPV